MPSHPDPLSGSDFNAAQEIIDLNIKVGIASSYTLVCGGAPVTEGEDLTESVDAINNAIACREYLEQNYVTDLETLTASLDVLDQAQSLPKIGSPTYHLIEHHHNVEHSSGIFTGGVVSDNGDGTVAATAGTGCIRATDSEVAEVLFFDFAGDDPIALTNNSDNFVYVDYNAGSPQIAVSTTEPTEHHTKILLAKVYREGTHMHLCAPCIFNISDSTSNIINRLCATRPFEWESGAILTESGVLNIAVSAGVFWEALNRFTTAAFDSSGADTFDYYYNDGAWQESSASQIDNTQYNDYGIGLATVANNRYGNHWIYMAQDASIQVVYGLGSYKLTEAIAAQPPGNLPPAITLTSRLIGKIIVLKNAVVFTSVESAFDVQFTGSGASDHNSLSNLQGGVADEYYHLDATEFSAVDGADPTYTEQNYVIDDEPVTSSIDALDIQVKDNADLAHAEVHTIVSHDTDATGAELTTLTDGSDAESLHVHPHRQFLCFGYSEAYAGDHYMAVPGDQDCTASTGYVMPRAGSIVGISVNVRCINFGGSGTVQIEAEESGGSTQFIKSFTISGAGYSDEYDTQAAGITTFNAGDRITAQVDFTGFTGTLRESAVVIEVEFAG